MKIAEVREYLSPKKITAAEGLSDGENLLAAKKFAQPSFSAEGTARVNDRGFIVLDFGRELHGGLRIVVNQAGGERFNTRVRIRFGESLSEAYSEPGGRGAGNPHAVRDFASVLLPAMSETEIGKTGFRFARLDFLEEGVTEIVSVSAVYIHSGQRQKGAFKCSDSLLNKIYNTAARTLYLNMQNGLIWDGIKRDRLVWAGDLHPETASALYLFGDCPNLENSLLYAAQSSPLPGWMNTIPSYSLWWIICVHDYYFHTGKDAFLRLCRDYLTGVLRQLEPCILESGEVCFEKSGNAGEMPYFLDWPTFNTPDAKIGVHAIALTAIKKAAVLLKALGGDSAPCQKMLGRLSAYRLGRADGKQAEALCLLAGLTGNPERLKSGGAAGISCFMSLYILSALAASGDEEAALEIIREYFGGMLNKGATSFWEDFDTAWIKGSSRIDRLPKKGEADIHGDFGRYCYKGFRHSLCHGWASAPASFLPQYILGISVSQPGCREITINPKLAGLEYAEGKFPTPYGTVFVRAEQKCGKTAVTYKAPAGVTAVVR